jgi:hypothetical protein
MKKLAIFLAIMLIPFSAFALDTISDNDLNDVTGQAGVSLFSNSIQIVKTGITTTYTDYDDVLGVDQDFNVVTGSSTLHLFFKGADPLMIDIVNMGTLQTYLGNVLIPTDPMDVGDTGIMITLPNAIELVNKGGATVSYYAGAVVTSNLMIGIATTGGTTTISHADQAWHHGYTQDNVWGNSAITTANDHSDQIGIIITSHED